MSFEKVLALKTSHRIDFQSLKCMRQAAVAEANRLEKLEGKANQRLSARFSELVRALVRSGSPKGASIDLSGSYARAQQAWDMTADDRLKIAARPLSVHSLLAGTERQLRSNPASPLGTTTERPAA